jgi:ABC-type branched-subunit amino acid transport system substrate-binding protein
MKLFLLFSLLLQLSACSGVSMITPERKVADNVDTAKLYRQEFLQKINSVKDKLRLGKGDLALKEIQLIKNESLNPVELSTKKNLNGVILFSQKKFEQSSRYFEEALVTAKEDPSLEAQINLNLGSSYFKQNLNEKAFEVLSNCNYKNLQDAEAKKFHQLYSVLSAQLGKKEQSLGALIRSLEDKKLIAELTSESRFLQTEELFMKLTESEKVRLLEDFDEEQNLAVAFLAYKEAEKSFREGNESKVSDYSEWIEKRYKNNSEIMGLVSLLGNRSQNNSEKIDVRYIGVILPLSGDHKTLGERALSGIDIALSEVMDNPEKKYRLEIKDSKGNPATGAFAMKDLMEQNNVSAVIGGLNSAEATKEYLEAKKYGVIFISLSKVLLPKEEKNHLLIEIPGSIESQVNLLFSEKMLSRIGQKPAILYPKTEIGEAYANEFWRQSKIKNLDVTGLISFDPTQTDFRDPVKNILGIKFNREREEEMSIVNDIASLESKKSIKRLQNLQPQIDFDWVFVPALPREAVQVLPNFNFFDAFNLKYIGVPSWRSELMLNEGYRYGNVFFIDEATLSNETDFSKKFVEKFKKLPNFVETISYDSLKVLIELIESGEKFETRQDLDIALTKKEMLSSASGSWKLIDDVWMKDLGTYKIKREGIEPVLD